MCMHIYLRLQSTANACTVVARELGLLANKGARIEWLSTCREHTFSYPGVPSEKRHSLEVYLLASAAQVTFRPSWIGIEVLHDSPYMTGTAWSSPSGYGIKIHIVLCTSIKLLVHTLHRRLAKACLCKYTHKAHATAGPGLSTRARLTYTLVGLTEAFI